VARTGQCWTVPSNIGHLPGARLAIGYRPSAIGYGGRGMVTLRDPWWLGLPFLLVRTFKQVVFASGGKGAGVVKIPLCCVVYRLSSIVYRLSAIGYR
jgi:hypothetical protein